MQTSLRIFIVAIIILLFIPTMAIAQEIIDLDTVEVALWPEYDSPAMLVIYRITLSPGVTLPAEVTLRIPSAAGVPNAVAAGQPDGSLLNLNFNQEPDGDWSRINFVTNTPDLQIEYYDPTLLKDGSKRHFEYQWPGDLSVSRMFVQVQRPIDATTMQISPNLGEGVQGPDGMIYFNAEVGSLNIGQQFIIVSDYTKETDTPSITMLQLESNVPIESVMSSSFTLQSALPFILGGLGFILIVGGGLWYWQSGRVNSSISPKRSRHKPLANKTSATTSGEASHDYCHQCGKRAQPGDRFCRVCGTQLRK